MNYDYLSKFHPKLIDVVVRDLAFWQRFNYELLRKSTRLHTIGLVHEGAGTFHLDDQSFLLTPGSVFQVIPGRHMHIQTNASNTLQFYSIQYSAHLSDESGQQFEVVRQGLPFPLHSLHADWQTLLRLYQSARVEWNTKQPGYEWRCKVMFFSIIDEIVRLEAVGPSGFSPDNGIERIVQYMNAHYDEPLSRAQLAALAGWSPTYFSTLFKEKTGQSPIQYLNKLRIDQAKNLLRSTSMPITEIASHIGLADSFYFARMFAKATGFSPSEYRKG